MTRAHRIAAARLPVAVLFLVVLLHPVSAGPLTDAMPHVKGTRAIVLEQLEALLAADKELQIVGQGSWLRSGAATASKAGGVTRQYKDPLLFAEGASDQDLRLVLQGKEEAAMGAKWATLSSAEQAAIRARDEAVMAAKWLDVRSKLAAGIRKAIPVGADARTIEQALLRYGFSATDAAAISKRGAGNIMEAILSSVNLYSPPQLVRMVVDEHTATAAFAKLGATPNLAGKAAEGVWGAGAKAATQEFEAGGRLFYNGANGARTGFVDLVHMAEEFGRYSFGGAANMSVQWAEKAAEAMRTGDMSLVAKYLKRLKETWALAIRKGGLRAESLRSSLLKLNEFIAAAEKGQSAALESGVTLQKFLRTARMQSSVLGQLARNPGHVDREIMLAILEAQPLSRWERVGGWFRDVWPSAENLAMFERAMQGAFMVFSAWQVGGTWGEKGMEDALRQAGVDVAMLVSLPIGALMSLTNSFIDNAKEFGYNSAVKPQEWREFLAGISSVTGYEGMTNVELSAEKLAVQCVSIDEVQRAVEVQAFNISRLKETGGTESEATTASREVIREKLIKNMTPIVLAEWLRARKVILTQYLDLALELDARMRDLVLSVKTSPEPIVLAKNGSATATAQLMSSVDLGVLQALLGRMEGAIRPLGGRQHIVPFGYRASILWEQDGKTREVSTTTNLKDLLAAHSIQVSGRGTVPLSARFRLDVRAPSLGGVDEARDVFAAQPLIARAYERRIPFAIEVTAPTKGHWKYVGVASDDLSPNGKQEAEVCRGCAPAWTVGELIVGPTSLTSRQSGTKDFMVDVRTTERKPYTIEQVLTWAGLPDVITPGVTYTTTATLSGSTSDPNVRPFTGGYLPRRISLSLPDGQQFLEPTGRTPQVSAQWKIDESAAAETASGARPSSVYVQIEFIGPGGSMHRVMRWDWVEAGGLNAAPVSARALPSAASDRRPSRRR